MQNVLWDQDVSSATLIRIYIDSAVLAEAALALPAPQPAHRPHAGFKRVAIPAITSRRSRDYFAPGNISLKYPGFVGFTTGPVVFGWPFGAEGVVLAFPVGD